MFGWIWTIGGISIFIALMCLTAWMHGKGELGSQEIEESIILSALCAILWPLILTVALAAAPFIGLYLGIKRISEKRG